MTEKEETDWNLGRSEREFEIIKLIEDGINKLKDTVVFTDEEKYKIYARINELKELLAKIKGEK